MMIFWMSSIYPSDPSTTMKHFITDQLSIDHYYYIIGFERMDWSSLERNFGFSYSDKVNMELLNKGYGIKVINQR